MFTLECPACTSAVTVPARALVLRVDGGQATSGEVLFTCLVCHATVVVVMDAPGVAALLSGGVTHLAMTAPDPGHPECPRGGPALTADDVIDLHQRLSDDSWIDEVAPE